MAELMDSQLFKAAIVGDMRFLDESINVAKQKGQKLSYYWLRSTSRRNNVIHISVEHNKSAEFISEALKRLSLTSLMKEQNVDGNTALHVAMLKGNKQIVEAILNAVSDMETKEEIWGIQNMNGDTPLHIALAKPRDDDWVNFVFSKVYHPTALLLNKSNESALHLYVRHFCHDIPQQEIKQEAMQKHIRALIQANKSSACIKDMEGLTPLLQAAKNRSLSVVRIIVEECPESIEIRDPNGKTFLHLIKNVGYQQFKNLVDMDMIIALINVEDDQGNTSLHLAVQRHDPVAVRALLECGADITIKNKEGISTSDIFESDTTFGKVVCANLALHPNTSALEAMKEKIENCMGKGMIMKDELYKAVVKGELAYLIGQTELNKQAREDGHFSESDFLSRTSNRSNIVQLAIKHGHPKCVKKALEIFPHMILEVDLNGDCSLHTAAKFNNPASEIVVDCFAECHNTHETSFVTSTPFQVRNSKGNTPLHEALRASNYNIASKMIKKYPSAAGMTNNAGETPLHMIARYGSPYILPMELIEELVSANKSVAYVRDVDGFTPLLRAVRSGQFVKCDNIIKQCPQSVEIFDLKDRSILHHLVDFITSIDINKSDALDFLLYVLHEYPQLRILRVKQDTNGDIPLHYAIKKGDLTLAKILYETCYETQNADELYMVDNQGNSIWSLLASHPDNFLPMHMKAKKRSWIGEFNLMKDEIYDATLKRDLSSLVEKYDNVNDLFSQSCDGSNIIHLAIKADDAKVLDVLEYRVLHELILDIDGHGETPVHTAAKLDNSASTKLLKMCLQEYTGDLTRSYAASVLFLGQNSFGNSPLHEALAASNYNFAIRLIREFGRVALVTNHIGETPLHIFARCGTNTGHIHKEIVEELIQADHDITFKRDKDGLTPLLRAAKSGRLWLCHTIISSCPRSLEIRDLNGRSMLHYCAHYKSVVVDEVDNGLEAIESLWDEAPVLDSLRFAQDKDGNTPLHYAIKLNCISLAYILVERGLKTSKYYEFYITNVQGHTVLHLLASHPTSSDHIEMKEKIEMNIIDQKVPMTKDLYEKIVNNELHVQLVKMDEDVNNVDWSRDLCYLFEEDEDVEDQKDGGANSVPTTSIDTDIKPHSRTTDGSNILHLAIKHQLHPAAAMKVLRKWPHLILQTDASGDNPLHIAARLCNNSGLKVLYFLHRYYWTPNGKFQINPFRMKNSAGDTPLHEASRASNAKAASLLIELDPCTALMKNNVGETPLHLFAKYGTCTKKETLDAFEDVLEDGLMAASIRDKEGFTPVLRAVQSGRILVALIIADKVPEAIQVRDFKGRTMLHHLRIHANEMVETSLRGGEMSLSDIMGGVDSLRTVRDLDGNTPLHYNLKIGNFATARLLMERCVSSNQRAELTMVNNNGESILDLLRMQIAKLRNDGDGNTTLQLAISQADVLNMNELMVKDLDYEKMKEELYNAAVRGSTTIFNGIKGRTDRKKFTEHYLARTSDGSNIVHLALRHGKKDFIEKALHHFPELILQRDYNFDTPTHVATRNYKARSSSNGITEAAKVVIDEAEECTNKIFGRKIQSWIPCVWELRNSQGNTPLHEAVRSGSLKSVCELVKIIKESDSKISDVISMANNEGDTPLHVYARYAIPINSRNNQSNKNSGEEVDSVALTLLIGDSNSTLYMRDRDGLTPLLRAAESGNFNLAHAIWQKYPQAMQLRDTSGRTFLHLMDLSKIISNPFTVFDIKDIDALRAVQDDEGNTPLHFAIKSGKYKKAKILMQRSVDAKDKRELYLTNQQGEYVETLLAQDDVPNEVINLYKKFDKKIYIEL